MFHIEGTPKLTGPDHIARVSEFLDGSGLRDPVVAGENPRVFCSADAGELVEWTQPVKDANGNAVEVSSDPLEYLTLEDVFAIQASKSGSHAFWMKSFNGYDIDFRGEETLCPGANTDGTLRYAKTSVVPQALDEGVDFTLGQANRHILFCPASFSPDGAHSYPSIAEAVSEDNYPTAGTKTADVALDHLLPVSATLYHELYHLTDDNNTPDSACKFFCFTSLPDSTSPSPLLPFSVVFQVCILPSEIALTHSYARRPSEHHPTQCSGHS